MTTTPSIIEANLLWFGIRTVYHFGVKDGDDLIDGYEVYSQVFEFDGDLESFYHERYEKYNYESD